MLNINLLKNNIPNKIDIPKKSKLHIVFLAVSLSVVLVIFLVIVAEFYFINRQAKMQTANLNTHAKTNMTEKKVKKITENNNTFNITVKLQDVTSNAPVSNLKSHSQEPFVGKKPDTNVIAHKSKEIANTNQNPIQAVSSSKPVLATQPIKKSCTVFCNSNNLNYLKSILNQKSIPYTIKEQGTLHYYYVVFVGGLEKSKFLDFENALRLKGYNVVGTRVINGKYYADLGRMNESNKDRFFNAWKNLGFDILVDKQKEMSNKKYEVNFLCTKDVFEDLRQKGFSVNAGRGAAW
ncbi:MAG TPA: hypothetical protein ENM99_06130 [Desulfurella acetivorans]|uniref:Uncharacterized protein n=1 Tax=Desulfurella acetivorans TaxID=33002 RepID=A0A7C6EBI7_DESAE|nr:hypothetical protein [Desulfurella acetivorans]